MDSLLHCLYLCDFVNDLLHFCWNNDFGCDKMNSIYGLTLEDLEEYFLSIGSKKFHALQLFSWLYEKRIESFDEVTNIKKEVIDEIDEFLTLYYKEYTGLYLKSKSFLEQINQNY